MTVFVDSSVWLAAVFARDARHGRATEILDEAPALGATSPDQRFSLVDRTSFVVMERLGNFLIYRYGANRDRAFEVLR